MKQHDKIQRINQLQAQIRELDYFILTIDVTERGQQHVKMKLIKTVETAKYLSFFGDRFYGIGHHQSEIPIPLTLLPNIVDWAHEKAKELQKELDSLIN